MPSSVSAGSPYSFRRAISSSVAGRTVPSRWTCSSIFGYGTRANVQPVHSVLVAVHLLAAAVWVGGTVALVFVGVPVIARLEGEARARSMRMLGSRWRPLGYGSLLVLGVTGVPLAADGWDAGSGFRRTL